MDTRIDLLREFYRGLPKDRAKVEIHRHGFPFLEELLADGATLEYGELTLSGLLHKYKLSRVSERRMDALLRSHVAKESNLCLYFGDRANSLFCFNLDNNHKANATVLIPEVELAIRVLHDLLAGLGCEPLVIASGRGYHAWCRLDREVENERLHDFMLRLSVLTVMELHKKGHDHHKLKFNFYPDKRIRDIVSLRLFGSKHAKTGLFSRVLTPEGLLDESASWKHFENYLKTRTIAKEKFDEAYAASMAVI